MEAKWEGIPGRKNELSAFAEVKQGRGETVSLSSGSENKGVESDRYYIISSKLIMHRSK